MNKTRFLQLARYQAVILGLLILILIGIVLNVNTGSVNITPLKILEIILKNPDPDGVESKIVWSIRLPRLLTAAVLGGALAVSGFLLQTFFRNPIAGPFVLGISSGAKMCVSFVIIFIVGSYGKIHPYLLVFSAFVGSLLIMGVVLLFSHKAKNMSMLLVIGIMIGYVCSAVTDFCIAFAEDSDIANLTSWSMGSFSGMTWGNVQAAALVVLPALAAAFCLAKPMAAYQMGEAYARSVGVDVRRFSRLLVLLSSLLAACVTAFAGPISFVGIAVPHLVKQLLGSARPLYVLPGCCLGGAAFCLLCDLIARSLFAPMELSISAVTAVFGAPVVIGLLLRRNREDMR